MAISLSKGQRVSLTKENETLNAIRVGLGWDPIQKSGGFLGGLFGSSSANFDCDASVIMLEANDRLAKKQDVVYFGNLRSVCNSVIHQGDNLTGDGDGDDEQILINLNHIPERIQKLIFVVNIYDCVTRKQDFGMVHNAFIRIVNMQNNIEMLRFNLTEQYKGKTALVVGEIYRHNNEWKFAAVGEGTNETSLSQMIQKYTV